MLDVTAREFWAGGGLGSGDYFQDPEMQDGSEMKYQDEENTGSSRGSQSWHSSLPRNDVCSVTLRGITGVWA